MDRTIPDIPNPTVSTLYHEYPPHMVIMASELDRNNGTKTLWHFDENLICHKTVIKFNDRSVPELSHITHLTPLVTETGQKIGHINHKNVPHIVVMNAAKTLKDGDSWSTFIERLNIEIKANELARGIYAHNNAKERYKKLLNGTYQPLSRTEELMKALRTPAELAMFIHVVNTPTIEREFGNTNTKTFDFVRVYVSVQHTDMDTKKAMFKKYRREIMRLVLLQIKTNKRFEKYEIPVNFLKLTQCVFTHDHQVMFLFELKNIQ